MLVTASANSLPHGSRLQSVSQPLTVPLAATGADNHITEGVGASCPAQELPRAMREGKGCRQMTPREGKNLSLSDLDSDSLQTGWKAELCEKLCVCKELQAAAL